MIAALAERQPAAAARALVDALRAKPELAGHALISDVAGSLRRDGEAAAALTLLAAAGGKTRRARAEEILAAIALGDPTRATAAVRGDEEIGAVLAPLLCETVAGKRVRGPRGAPAAALLRCLAQAVAGKTAAAAKELDKVAAVDTHRFFVAELRAALDLVSKRPGKRAVPAVARLSASSLVQGNARAEALLAAHVDAHAVEAPRNAPARVILAARLRGANTPEARAVAVATLDPSLFSREHRGAALLFRAFALAPKAQRGAGAQLFDAALAAGADRLEALRGRALFLSRDYEGDCRCERCVTTAERAAEAWLRVGQEIGDAPPTDPLVLAAARRASKHAGWASDRPRVERAANMARRAGARSGLLSPEVEADLVADLAATFTGEDPARARTLAESALATSPRSHTAWEVRVAALEELGLPTDEVLRQAHAATGDASFAEEARHARRATGREAQLEPGATPGAVAEELGWRASEERLVVPLPADAAAALDRLGDRAAAAVCAYTMAAAWDAGVDGFPIALLGNRLAKTQTPDGARILASVAVAIELDEHLVRAIRSSAETIPAALIPALVEGAWEPGGATSGRVLVAFAERLGASELTRLRRAIAGNKPPQPDGIELADELLEPEVSLSDLLVGGDDVGGLPGETTDELVAAVERSGGSPELIGFAAACALYGLDEKMMSKVLATPAGEVTAKEIGRLVAGPRTKAAESRVEALFRTLNIKVPKGGG